MTVRKLLNLTYAWLFDLIGGTDAWKKEYEHVFDPNAHEDYDYVDAGPMATSSSMTGARAPDSTTVDVSNEPVAKLLFHGY